MKEKDWQISHKKLHEKFDAIKDDVSNIKHDMSNNDSKFEAFVKDSIAAINSLIDYTKCQDEYIEALTYLSKFRWKYILSKSLRHEAQHKKYEDIENYKQISKPILNTQLDKKDYTESNQYKHLCINGYATFSPQSYITIESSHDPKEVIKETIDYILNPDPDKNKEQVKYNQTVEAVVALPCNYSKEVVYNVYCYLKDILKIDTDVLKYSN